VFERGRGTPNHGGNIGEKGRWGRASTRGGRESRRGEQRVGIGKGLNPIPNKKKVGSSPSDNNQ